MKAKRVCPICEELLDHPHVDCIDMVIAQLKAQYAQRKSLNLAIEDLEETLNELDSEFKLRPKVPRGWGRD